MKNRNANRKLNILWEGQELEHCPTPKYLGVKLDRTLSFKQHCADTRKKVSTRNNIIRKLTGTSWGADPSVLRTSSLALSISAAEYAAPVWKNSVHAKQVDVAVNESVRIITGCMKPTPLDKIYSIAGIAPPKIRRQVSADIEKTKQAQDPRHMLYGHQTHFRRLKSRRSFIATSRELHVPPETRRVELWEEAVPNPLIPIKEEISCGAELPFVTWKCLNRLRTGVGRCAYNMRKWKLSDCDKCDCGSIQDMSHLLNCPELATTCNHDDLLAANISAVQVAQHWEKKI